MIKHQKVIVIDAGNTSIKAGYFENDELIEVKRFTINNLDSLSDWQKTLDVNTIVLSSVLKKDDTLRVQNLFECCHLINNNSKLPFKIVYETPNSLGIDRICNACYLFNHSISKYAVSIDIGTCVKFDVIDKTIGYLGGSISPGIDLRYKSLNDYTGNLPLLSNKTLIPTVGTSTESSIVSGVMNGLQNEINGLMEHYRLQFSDLTFFMTGGDASFFDFESKNDIFADENLTIKGLYEIYKHNA